MRPARQHPAGAVYSKVLVRLLRPEMPKINEQISISSSSVSIRRGVLNRNLVALQLAAAQLPEFKVQIDSGRHALFCCNPHRQPG
jgi:hypothetical protein